MPDRTFSSSFRRLHLHKKRSEVKQPFAQLAGVSLLKPLKGVDPNLMSNLETFFTLDYPKVRGRCISAARHVTAAGARAPSAVDSLESLSLWQYEILLCVQDQDDPAIDVCKKLLAKYPDVDARLFVGEVSACCGERGAPAVAFGGAFLSVSCSSVAGGKKVGINPKINNLMPGYEGARYNLVWICDSGIRGR